MEQNKTVEALIVIPPMAFEEANPEAKESHDVEDIEAQSQISCKDSLEEAISERRTPKNRTKRWTLISRLWHARRTRKDGSAKSPKTKKARCCKWIIIAIVVLAVFAVIAAIVYVSLVRTLIARLAPPAGHSGLQTIVGAWKEPDANGAFKYKWIDDFSRDIVPKNCLSHNDYWRSVPLYEALAAGCTSVEADVWLTDDGELLVGQTLSATTQYRTLRSLYLDPISTIFDKRNVSTASVSDKEIGMFDSEPSTSTVLLIDMKSDGHKIWPVLQTQLQPLRDRNWLTYYDGKTLHQGPLTIVGTGQTPFELIQRNVTNRFIFYDAPLVSVSQPDFNTTNSYFASADFQALMPDNWRGKFTPKREQMLQQQILAAEGKGLKSRYYNTPAWPISLRDNVWAKLKDLGTGTLNVDDLVSATRWNWGFCVVAGFVLCGSN